jgi:putative transposase
VASVHNVTSSDEIERRFTTLFPSGALEEHAEAVGVVKRDGKLQIPPLVWSFAFGFATSESRTLAAFRRSYNSTAGQSLSPGGYYQRLTPSLAEYLRDLVKPIPDKVAVPYTVTDEFNRFRDVMIADGTVLRLHQFLSDEFEGRNEEQAGARLHLLHNSSDQTLEQFNITDGRACRRVLIA